MVWRRGVLRAKQTINDALWWATIAPFCVGSPLATLGASSRRPLDLGSEPDQYPTTELIGRLWSFRSRLRFARALLIIPRTLVLCAFILVLAHAAQLLGVRAASAWLPLLLVVVLGWGFHLAFHHVISSFEVARLVDRRAGLQAQLATAVEYTLGQRLNEPLARTQVRLATIRLRELEPRSVVPLVWPGGDARLLAMAVVMYGALSVVGTFGFTRPQTPRSIDLALAKLASQSPQAPTAYTTIDPLQAPIQAADVVGAPIPPQLKTLQQELASQAITPAQYQSQLRQLEQQLQAQASQSLAAQQALNALAAALKDSSTTRGISDSLAQGNYQQAASQLNDLSSQVARLSPDAQAELARRLAQAAAQTQQLDPRLSRNASQASDALRQGDTGQASRSLQALAQSIQQASSKIAAQSQLGQALRQVQQNLGSQPGQQSTTAPAQAAQPGQDATAQVTQGTPGESPQGNPPGNAQASLDQQSGAAGAASSQQSGSSPAQGAAGPSQQIQQDSSSNQGGAGSGPGGNALAANPAPLDVSGVKLVILGQASGQGSGQTEAGDRSNPLTAPNGSAISAPGGSAPAASNVPITVHQESNAVPLELKPVVREYFSNAGS